MPQNLHESSNVVKVAAAVIVVAGLSFGAPILVPIALSILISFALTPLVARLERWHFGHAGSVLTIVFLGVALAAGTVLLVAGQAADLMTRLPDYRGNLSKKFEVVRRLERKWTSATGELARASQEPEKPGATAATDPSASAPRPETPNYVPLWDSAGKSIQFLGTAGGVVILVIFILLQRRDLHARALRVAGGGRYGVTSQALNEASQKLSRYILAEVALNTLYGVVITVGLLLIGIPNAFVWGLLCGLLRFVPYVGPILAAAMPIGMSLAVSSGWGLPLATIGFFAGVELVVNNIIEPLVHGRSTGLSAVAILAAAAFWTWLWGPVGLILSTPLTVCIYVLGKHYPPLHFFHILMGEVVDKSLAARLYPRLVASDRDAVWEAVSEERLRSGLAEAFDVTLVPALELLKRNRRAGEVEPEEAQRIVRAVEEIAEEAAEEAMTAAPPVPVGEVLCIPASDETDAACCRMLTRVLELEGISARVCLPEAIAAAVAEARKPSVFCVLDVRSPSPRRLESLTRRLLTRYPAIPVVAARLPANGTADAAPSAESPTLHSASTIEECREVVKRLVASAAAASAAAAVPVEAPVSSPTAGQVS
ncbi:MAG: AI-2E family transporter [Planctomycetes bacterium]|nr:AI-2E family transporter [Planctomycetota bacterium]